MSTKLRDLIRNVRACKTAAEERALIQREKAAIRESFAANENEYRRRNVAKLLFISMLGHDTDFGQLECLKLITANSFTEKRIGYLGLTQLFNERSEILMMATNRIRIDLCNQSNYIVSLALMALSEICTTEMCRDLASEVLKLLGQGTSYIKKKAALASTRIVKRVPEKLDDFVEKVEVLMEDRHHGVLIATLQLCQHIIQINSDKKQKFVRFVAPMTRILKSLVSTYSAEYDVSGISDPFLQIEILRFFRIMCEKSPQLSEEVSDILTQVTTNTTSNKNTGNAVLYEAVKTIMSIESANTLKTLGINILGKFLANKDANSKYVSLFMLQKVLKHDIQAVQKYKSTILDCLKENDSSIKTLALDLIYMITNESNVKSIIKELLNQLLNLTDESEFIQELTNKICVIVSAHAPSRRWYIDTLIRVLILAGNYVQEDHTSSLIHLISGTPELQSYAVHKLFFSLSENLNQEGLARITVYCLGDFGHILVAGGTSAVDNSPIQVSESEVVQLISRILSKSNQSDTIKEYSLSALIKLYSKFKSCHTQMAELIKSQSQSSSIEVQKRAIEYLRLLETEWDGDRTGICEQIPPSKSYLSFYQSKPIGETEIDEYPPEAAKGSIVQPSTQRTTQQSTTSGQANLEEILGMDFPSVTPGVGATSPSQQLIDSMLNLTAPPTQTAQPTPIGASGPAQNDPLSLLSLYSTPQPQPSFQQPIQQAFSSNLLYPQQQQPIQQQQQLPNLLGNTQSYPPAQQPYQIPQQQQQYPPQQPVQPLYQPQQAFVPQTTYPQQNFQQPVQPPVQPQVQQPVQQGAQSQTHRVFDDGCLQIQFIATKDLSAENTTITAYFNNLSGSHISNIVFSVAVLKYLKMQMNPLNSNQIPPKTSNQVQQVINITNTAQGVKAIVMKLKINYQVDGRQVASETTVNQFPASF